MIKKDKIVSVRLTEEEYKTILVNAQMDKRKLSDYIRLAALGQIKHVNK